MSASPRGPSFNMQAGSAAWYLGLFSLVALFSLIVPAAAEKRVALVIGNSAYKNIAPLDNPNNDARLMAATLRDLGFVLVGNAAHTDLEKPALDALVQRFSREIQDAEVGLFYYAGHGVQVRGTNYLVPVGANPTREADVDFQMVDVNLVLRQMESAGTKLNLVILDACRNNPFSARGLRTSSGGLAQMQAPEGTLISYATQPGNVAQDGTDGNSPYTKALAAIMRKPGLGIFDAFNEVGLVVKRATKGSQQPWVSSSPIEGRFFFSPQVVSIEGSAEKSSTVPSTGTPSTPPTPRRQQLATLPQPATSVAVRRIPVRVQPYYAAAPSSEQRPKVEVGRAFNHALASTDRKEIIEASERIAADPGLVTPMTMMVLAIRLYDVGLRDEGVFWFYVAKARYITLEDTVEPNVPLLASASEGVKNFARLAGPYFNTYAFCDPDQQHITLVRALDWVEKNPYEAVFMAQLIGNPADRRESMAQSIKRQRASADQERAKFRDPKFAADFAAARKKNKADKMFCWK